MDAITPEDLELLDEELLASLGDIMLDPKTWAETFLMVPTTGKLFKANYIQDRILSSRRMYNAIRVHRRGGKAQPLYATVHTPTGPVAMGSLQVGDLVCTPDGGKVPVTAIHPQGQKQIYRLTLDDGTSVEACGEHLWEVYTKDGWKGGRGKSRQQYALKVLTTEQIAENLTYEYSDRVEFNYKLEGIQPVDYEARELPLDPYLMGVMLGDGHMKNCTFSSGDPELVERLRSRTDVPISRGYTKQGTQALNYKIGGRTIQVFESLGLRYCLSDTKFIPKDYLYNSTENRLELLRGLMDTDGSAKGDGRIGQAEFCSISKQLAEDVAELARSLGCKVSIKASEGGYTKNGVRKTTSVRYRVLIRVPAGLEIFALERKKCGGMDARYLRRTIVKVEKLGMTEMQCITIDHPRHLYITDNYTPTHNSYSFAILALFHALNQDSCEILIICPAATQVNNLFTTLREFIRVNSWLSSQVSGNKQAPQSITFKNGSRIMGFTTGARSKGAAMSIRGQGADVLLIDEAAYLNQEDWPTIIPIMQGDAHRRGKVRVYLASTPAYSRGYYYEFCCSEDPTIQRAFNRIHVSIMDNPSVDDNFRAECKAMCLSDMHWEMEYLAEFPTVGEGVFPKNLVQASRRTYFYHEELKRAQDQRASQSPVPPRTMGVDWDKHNADGHGPNIAVLEARPNGGYRVIWREEIPQSQFSLDNACKKIIELNAIFQPQWIYVDRGQGEHQIETLQLYGQRDRESGLAHKVVGVSFAENVECPLPAGGTTTKRFKQVMVQTLRGWLERGVLEMSTNDDELLRQFLDFHIISKTDHTLKFNEDNEHGIDAVGMAAMAMHARVQNPFMAPPAKEVRHLKLPEPGGAKEQPVPPSLRWGHNPSLAGNITYERTGGGGGFSSFERRHLGGRSPGSRSSF